MMTRNELSAQALLPLLFCCWLILYLLIMWPALNGPFLFDDFSNLIYLKEIDGHFNSSTIIDYLLKFTGSPGRPLSALSFLINDYAWPSEPYSFKYTNLFIHLFNGVLLFGLLRQLAKVSSKLPQNIFWPLIAMAAWLSHPLQISAQMLIVQRMTLLSATFCFIGLWAYINLLDKAKNILGAFLAMAALGTFTVLAFLSKENGALLPLMAWVLNATLLNSLFESKTKKIQLFIFFACGIPSLILLSAILYMGIQPNAYTLREFNLYERLITESHILLDYLNNIFIPKISGSGIYYDDYPVTRSLLSPISSLLISIGIISSIAFSLLFRKRYSLASFAILWFFAGHVMESTVLPLELYFEHRNYMPLLGPVMAITAFPFFLAMYRKLALCVLAIWLSFLTLLTSLQAPVWGNQAVMATIWAAENPNSVRATQELSRYYFLSDQKEKALETLLNAYEYNKNVIDYPINALLLVCDGVRSNNQSHILASVMESLSSNRYSPAVLLVLTELRGKVQTNYCDETINQQQWWDLTDMLLQNKVYSTNAGQYLHIERANLRVQQRNFSGTMDELEKAYYLEPNIEITQKTAEILISAGLFDEAIIWLKRGVELDEPYFDRILGSKKTKSLKLIQEIQAYNKQNPQAKMSNNSQ